MPTDGLLKSIKPLVVVGKKDKMLNEKKYLYKKDALTDYFKGKLSAKELDKIAKDNFGVGIATKKELSSFLSNKFTQDVMSDTYGIPSGTLVKRVRGLMKFAEGIEEDTDVGHQDDEPNMLKSTALEIMEYGKKLMDKLDKYDDMEGEVDFPNWWQSKLTLARDYVSKAYHYLDSEEKTSETIDRSFRTYRDDEGDDEGPVDEGKKRYNQKDGVGKSKYVISYHDGKKKHKDGSDFFDIQIFRNKKDLAKFVNALHKGGYKYGFGESVNEAYVVLYSPKKGVKPVTTAAYKDKKDAEKWAKDLGGITMIVKKKVRYIDETNLNECWDTHKQVGFKMKNGKRVPNCVPKNEIKEDKNQIVQLKKKVGKSEIKFYDALSKIEKKLGKKKYRAFLEKGLKDFKINAKHYDYRSNGAAEEKLFQLAK